jgi:hypothetical protein
MLWLILVAPPCEAGSRDASHVAGWRACVQFDDFADDLLGDAERHGHAGASHPRHRHNLRRRSRDEIAGGRVLDIEAVPAFCDPQLWDFEELVQITED